MGEWGWALSAGSCCIEVAGEGELMEPFMSVMACKRSPHVAGAEREGEPAALATSPWRVLNPDGHKLPGPVLVHVVFPIFSRISRL